jgi:DNA-3-methyladenine glycosylase
MHYCCNIVTGPAGHGAAVLLRALEPISGQAVMADRRGRSHDLANGPAKLCQALGINKDWNGHDLSEPPLQLVMRPAVAQSNIVQTTRVGISRAKDVPWRFYIKDNPHVSQL